MAWLDPQDGTEDYNLYHADDEPFENVCAWCGEVYIDYWNEVCGSHGHGCLE